MNIIQTNLVPVVIGPHSQACESHRFIFTSGQIPLSPESNSITGINVTEQTKHVVKKLKAVLKASALSFAKMVKTTCFLMDINDCSEVYAKVLHRKVCPLNCGSETTSKKRFGGNRNHR